MFAGAAIGVSHLVQSTRAGADFGFGLIWALLLINLIKYPFFAFGVYYTSRTGQDLLTAFNKNGALGTDGLFHTYPMHHVYVSNSRYHSNSGYCDFFNRNRYTCRLGGFNSIGLFFNPYSRAIFRLGSSDEICRFGLNPDDGPGINFCLV